MPRPKKTDKFSLYTPNSRGAFKDTLRIGLNDFNYTGDQGAITLQDFLDFLAMHEIKPAAINMPWNFRTTAQAPNWRKNKRGKKSVSRKNA